MNQKINLDYNKEKDLIVVSYRYNEILNKRLRNLGFYYSKETGGNCIRPSAGIIVFLLSLKARFTQSISFQSLLEEYRSQVNSINIKLSTQEPRFPSREFQLYKYQQRCVDFIASNSGNCIINDEHGLGKTVEALTYCSDNGLKTLVLTPKVLIGQWEGEIKKVVKSDYMANFEVVNIDQTNIDYQGFDIVIIDEAHNLYRLNSERFKRTNSIVKSVGRCLILTAVSIEENPMIFYNFSKLLRLNMTKKEYINSFFETKFENNRVVPISPHIERLKLFFSPYCIRRTADQIGIKTKKESSIIPINLHGPHKGEYGRKIQDISLFITANDIIDLQKQLSSAKAEDLLRIIKLRLSEDSKYKVVIASQFNEILEFLNTGIKASAIYDENITDLPQILLLNSSKYREGVNLDEYQNIILVDQFSDKNKNKQIVKRIDRVTQHGRQLNLEVLETGELDTFLRRMPSNLNFDNQLKLIQKYINKIAA